jgi:hypothetical protein
MVKMVWWLVVSKRRFGERIEIRIARTSVSIEIEDEKWDRGQG